VTGRRLCSDDEAIRRGFGGADCGRRRQVLRESIAAFEHCDPPGHYHRLAKQNLERWRSESRGSASSLRVEVLPKDWGEVALSLTRTHGTSFAVLNMANAYVPGGAYVEGAVAQEENMFRRTDCHFRIGDDDYGKSRHSSTLCASTASATRFSAHSGAAPSGIRLNSWRGSTRRKSRSESLTFP
jgi:hypothetical protein